jgi:hypothetical protein
VGSSSGDDSSGSSSINPLTLLGSGASFDYKMIGNGVVEGKPSVGYSFSAKAPVGSLNGTMWFQTPNGLLLTMTANASIVAAPNTKPQTLSVKLTVSNYNDPSLKIPAVKNGQP